MLTEDLSLLFMKCFFSSSTHLLHRGWFLWHSQFLVSFVTWSKRSQNTRHVSIHYNISPQTPKQVTEFHQCVCSGMMPGTWSLKRSESSGELARQSCIRASPDTSQCRREGQDMGDEDKVRKESKADTKTINKGNLD